MTLLQINVASICAPEIYTLVYRVPRFDVTHSDFWAPAASGRSPVVGDAFHPHGSLLMSSAVGIDFVELIPSHLTSSAATVQFSNMFVVDGATALKCRA
jgi:hypothetical protein